jgi:hypothetical protein
MIQEEIKWRLNSGNACYHSIQNLLSSQLLSRYIKIRIYTTWVDNIKIDLRETGWDDMDWINLAQDRDRWRALVNMVMYLWGP